MDEQKLLEKVLFNRGMLMGLQHALKILLSALKKSLTPVEIEKVLKDLDGLTAVVDDETKGMLGGSFVLPPSYERGFELGCKSFLESLTIGEDSVDVN